ncbi:GH92 family glycosyl hydrolase [Fulvivirga ligni]|uniref:GH92 family glycosyl hydrolase n=1 Tax=Fulvivirga ligni TaxID=2904246 RepID=UPI001F16F6D6|nr:GH92 family glycosyl hydrolase [Fulvivirga ligni]UII19541.1 GH92 family glycosyl hydrolase [Fulvivirga ligni]
MHIKKFSNHISERLLAGLALLLVLPLLLSSCQTPQASDSSTTTASGSTPNYAQLVNSTIGSQGKGHGIHEQYLEAGYTFPGAMYPMGMAQFTTTFFNPQKGFVINQMSGAGCGHMGNCPTLPLAGDLTASPVDMMNLEPQIEVQEAHAGYYKAALKNNVTAELTVTPRSGMARFSYSQNSDKGTVIIGTGINANDLNISEVKINGNSFEGKAEGGQFCGFRTPYILYFYAEFEKEPLKSGTWKDGQLSPDSKAANGSNSGVYFTFDVSKSKSINYKIGISYVSLANAKENLKTENTSWDFDEVKNNAETAWNGYLGRIQATGASKDKEVQFYSALYHVFNHPNIFNDVNGEYIGSDGQIHKAEGFTYYTGFSNWDTYRTQTQLISMLAPEETSDIIKSHILFAQRSGGGWPRWVLNNFETGIMQGDPTSALVANAYAFGAQDFDHQAAFEIMKKSALEPGTRSQGVETRPHLDEYLKLGYTQASMSLEYNLSDFAIAQFAKQALNDQKAYDLFLSHSQYWKNLYNPKTNWLQSRNADGSWKNQRDDWREASFKNYFWMVPQNLETLIDTIGGKDYAAQRLDEFFMKLNANYHQEWFAAGNEPDFQVPWIYNWVDQPWKTQALVRRIIREQYTNRASGLPGNDDMGAMGAFYVFANIGIYPVIPGVGGFSLNNPSFEKIVVKLGSGNTLTILGGSEQNEYTQSLQWNGNTYDQTWISWDEIKKGGTLNYSLGSEPNKSWGLEAEPPSYN